MPWLGCVWAPPPRLRDDVRQRRNPDARERPLRARTRNTCDLVGAGREGSGSGQGNLSAGYVALPVRAIREPDSVVAEIAIGHKQDCGLRATSPAVLTVEQLPRPYKSGRSNDRETDPSIKHAKWAVAA